MPRKQTPLRPVQVRYICDSCGEGDYLPKGSMLLTNTPQFLHECTACGDAKIFTEKYPTIRYALEGEGLDLDNYIQQTL